MKGQTSILVASLLALALSTSGLRGHGSAQGDSTVVVLLGTGMPRPNPEASGPATAVVVGERVFLFDVGVHNGGFKGRIVVGRDLDRVQ